MMYSLLKETKNCLVCMKSFPNGRALGAHMRSHTRKRSASNADSATGSTIPSLQASNKLGANFRPHETVLLRSVHTSEVGAGPKPDLKREEGGQKITGKRKIVVEYFDEENSSEFPCSLTAVEVAALCLMEMSEVKWPANRQNPKAIEPCLVSTRKGKETYTEKYIQVDSEDSYKYVYENGDVKFLPSNVGILTEDKDEDDDETYLVSSETKGKKKYVCECGKVLHSYQALGGHRTSHRNKRLKLCEENGQAGPVVRRQYACEICGRMFASGQALGGHKKVHYVFLQPSN